MPMPRAKEFESPQTPPHSNNFLQGSVCQAPFQALHLCSVTRALDVLRLEYRHPGPRCR